MQQAKLQIAALSLTLSALQFVFAAKRNYRVRMTKSV